MAELQRGHHSGGKGVQVSFRLNQACGEIRGVTTVTIGPSSLREAAGIDGNIFDMVAAWERGRSDEEEAINGSLGSSPTSIYTVVSMGLWRSSMVP